MVKRTTGTRASSVQTPPPPPPRGVATKPVLFFRAWREFRGVKTQSELSDKCGVPRSVISRLENGTIAYRQKWLEPIALALDCLPSDLISVDPNMQLSIIQIYARIPEKHRAKVETMLQSYIKNAR